MSLIVQKYGGTSMGSPERIREVARENGVPVVPDPPLARSLYASVEIGHFIPEELFGAVAAVLAFVYRTAAQKAAA